MFHLQSQQYKIKEGSNFSDVFSNDIFLIKNECFNCWLKRTLLWASSHVEKYCLEQTHMNTHTFMDDKENGVFIVMEHALLQYIVSF